MKLVQFTIIVILLIAIIGIVAFTGITLYQNKSTNTVSSNSPTRSSALPQVISSSASADYAEPCNAQQRQQTIDLIIRQNEELFSEISWLQSASMDSMQDFSRALVQLEHVISGYNAKYRGRFPKCAGGYITDITLELLYSNLQAFMVLNELALYVQQNRDTQIFNRLLAGIDERKNLSDSLLEENDLIDALRQNSLSPNGIPACSEATVTQNKTKYEPLVDELIELFPTYLDFMNLRQGDFKNLFRLEELAVDYLQVETELCIETIEHEVALSQFWFDTTITVHMAQVAAFEQLRGNVAFAEELESYVSLRHERLLENIEVVQPN